MGRGGTGFGLVSKRSRKLQRERERGASGGGVAWLYVATFILAFCSIMYELLLGQLLSAYLGNTVLRYSVTIGMYLFSMGVGAMAYEKFRVEDGRLALTRVEWGLTVIGLLSVPMVQAVDSLFGWSFFLTVVTHGLILLIGFLTGLELPLLMQLGRGRATENQLIGCNYGGAFLGTVLFAFFFYPKCGLLATVLTVTFLNAVVGVMLYGGLDKGRYPKWQFRGQMVTVVVIILLFFFLNSLEELLITSYQS